MANDADVQRLNERRPTHSLPFDSRPLSGLGLNDMEIGHLQTDWASARAADHDPDTYPAFESWLVQRQLGRAVDGEWVPNAAAVLIHGKSPQDRVPAARVDLVRYNGSDVDAPVSSRRICTGTLPDQLEAAWAWVSAQTELRPAAPDGIRDAFVADYPEEALKELIRNLVQHRLYEGTHAPGRVEWFDDHVVFSNPGGPFGSASEGEFGEHSDYRNPLITARLVELGYVQQLGRGVRRVRRLLADNGNPPLLVETDGFTRVTVRKRPCTP